MRMTQGQYDALRRAIATVDTSRARARYAAGDFPRADTCRDRLTRYRWDCFYACRGNHALVLPGMGGSGDVAARTGGLNDDHIETALRRIIPSLS